jgi:hypothetical protein
MSLLHTPPQDLVVMVNAALTHERGDRHDTIYTPPQVPFAVAVDEPSLLRPGLPIQDNGYDCGPFLCAFAEHVLLSSSLVHLAIPTFRVRVRNVIMDSFEDYVEEEDEWFDMHNPIIEARPTTEEKTLRSLGKAAEEDMTKYASDCDEEASGTRDRELLDSKLIAEEDTMCAVCTSILTSFGGSSSSQDRIEECHLCNRKIHYPRCAIQYPDRVGDEVKWTCNDYCQGTAQARQEYHEQFEALKRASCQSLDAVSKPSSSVSSLSASASSASSSLSPVIAAPASSPPATVIPLPPPPPPLPPLN